MSLFLLLLSPPSSPRGVASTIPRRSLLARGSSKRVHWGEIAAGRSRRRPFQTGDLKMEHHKTKCRAPEGPILCINNCGFFGSAATMNMCSKCHKDMILKQQAELAASSIGSLVSEKEPIISGNADVESGPVEPKSVWLQASDELGSSEAGEAKAKEGPNRCNTCRKRVGLTGFRCRCGNLFCSVHHHSDKHDCPFDYAKAARDAIAKANPVVKAEKLDKI